jgi:hypothetical protein
MFTGNSNEAVTTTGTARDNSRQGMEMEGQGGDGSEVEALDYTQKKW